ncbi:MAG: hypothetical protein ACRD7E_14200 [Bryobacteraceae bacterium]
MAGISRSWNEVDVRHGAGAPAATAARPMTNLLYGFRPDYFPTVTVASLILLRWNRNGPGTITRDQAYWRSNNREALADSRHAASGLGLFSQSDQDALRGLVTVCDDRTADIEKGGPIELPTQWASILDTTYNNITAPIQMDV